MSPEEARKLLAEADLIHSAETVQAAVAAVGRRISERLRDANPLVLCVMSGGVPFVGCLLGHLDFPLDFDYLHVSRYGEGTVGHTLSWRSAPWASVKDRTVLVVDDILDEGVTLAAVRERLRQLGASEVLTAVFADKENGRDKPVHADFVGLTVPDRFVFGFGMDVAGAWRNLPAIYARAQTPKELP